MPRTSNLTGAIVKTAPNRHFIASDIPSIYKFPAPSTQQVVVGVVSLGGTLTGVIDSSGNLIGGDINNYWTSIGMTSLPTIKVVRINGSALDPAETTATIENIIDISMIGACCPTSKLTIVVYYYNQYTNTRNIDSFYATFNYAINTPVMIPGLGAVKPSIISCSWGAPESYFSRTRLLAYDALFASAAAAGITITTAAGDNGSSNGTSETVADFPTSSPNVISCGGTHLICPNQDVHGNYIYSGATETTWSWSPVYRDGTGGGISAVFKGPPGTAARHVPDLALVADPTTGVGFFINGVMQVIGGTSIVSPAIAGLLACLPKPPKGLLTKLYALPSAAFNDITVGNNGAYFAGAGYDNCTGMGSINGTAFVSAYTSLLQSPVTGLTLTGTLTSLIGASQQLTSSIPNVWWSSTNPAIATVVNGRVTGVAEGSTTITAISKDGFFTASVIFTVISTLRPSIVVSNSVNGPQLFSLLLRRSNILTLYARTTNSTLPVIWSSSNGHIASVVNGVVRASRVGNCIITATCGTIRASVLIRVI